MDIIIWLQQLNWQTVISIISLIVSVYLLWKIHLSPFKLHISFGDPTLKTYKITPDISGGKTVWHIPSIDIPITFLNTGAKVGRVLNLRMVFTSKKKGINKTSEYRESFEPRWCVHYEDYNNKKSERFKWLRESIEQEWYPFYLLQNNPVSKHVILESFRWDQFPTGNFQITLELLSDESKDWRVLAEYKFSLSKSEISWLKKGSAYSLPKKEIIKKSTITIVRV